jgi:hypothetical protein
MLLMPQEFDWAAKQMHSVCGISPTIQRSKSVWCCNGRAKLKRATAALLINHAAIRLVISLFVRGIGCT